MGIFQDYLARIKKKRDEVLANESKPRENRLSQEQKAQADEFLRSFAEKSGINTLKNAYKNAPSNIVWGLKQPAPEVLQKLEKKGDEAFSKAAGLLQKTPKFTFAERVQNPVLGFGANVAQGFLNAPSNAISSYGKSANILTRQAPLGQKIGTAGELGLDMASLLPIGQAGKAATTGAKSLVTTGAKELSKDALTKAIWESTKTGAKYGGAFSGGYALTGGLQRGDRPMNIASDVIQQSAIGTLGGGLFGGGIPMVSSLPSAIKGSLKKGKVTTESIPAHWVPGEPVKTTGTINFSDRMTTARGDFPKLPADQRYVGQPTMDMRQGFGNVFTQNTERLFPEQVVTRTQTTPGLREWGRQIGEALPRPGMTTKDVSGGKAGYSSTPSGEDYFISTKTQDGKVTFQKAENAKKVDNNLGLDLFVSKYKDGTWAVSEGRSGSLFGGGGFKTRKSATESIDEVIKNVQGKGIDINKSIESKLSQNGVSPRYGQGKTEFSQDSQSKELFGDIATTRAAQDTNLLESQIAGKGKVKQSKTPQTEVSAQGAQQIPQALEILPGGKTKGKLVSTYKENLPAETTTVKPGTFYNVDRLDISDKAKKSLQSEIKKSGEKISSVTGKTLTNEEVVKTAENTSKILNRTIGREQTQNRIAQNLKLRQSIAAKAEKGFENRKDAEDFIDLWLKDKSAGTDIARQLQARRIKASQSEQEGIDLILESIYRNNKNADEIIAASKRYDLSNPEEVQKFYREFVKPGAAEWIDLVRYNSMLTSPTTHLVNISSNLQGAGAVEPLTKTVTGVLDAMKSALTGSKREYYAGEGKEYLKGAIGGLGEASQKMWDTMSGKKISGMQDIYNIPLTKPGTVGRVVENVLGVSGRLLQGVDEFFTALGEAGNLKSLAYRESKGTKVPNIGQEAYKQAKKTIFNAPFSPDNEGHVLRAFEFMPKFISSWRYHKNPLVSTISKFTFPFAKIGSNLLKAGIEYSPLGVSTLWGAKNKTEQLAKAIIGTASALGAATLLGQNRLTFAEPTNEEQKNAFRDAGMQPYSVKIGNTWVSYAKLHPAFAFNFALVSAVDDALKNKRLSEDTADAILSSFAKFGSFIYDQSYMRNIGDTVKAAQGSESGWAKVASNYAQQLIPFRALMGYVERIVDPYQRKVDPDGSILDKQMQYVMAQIPGLAENVPVRTNELGQPIENKNRFLNAISPARITTEVKEAKASYEKMIEKSQARKEAEDIEKALQKGKEVKAGEIEPGIYQLKDGSIKWRDSENNLVKATSVENARLNIKRDELKATDKDSAVSGGNFLYKDEFGDVRIIKGTTPLDENDASNIKELKDAGVVVNSETLKLYKENGISSTDTKKLATMKEDGATVNNDTIEAIALYNSLTKIPNEKGNEIIKELYYNDPVAFRQFKEVYDYSTVGMNKSILNNYKTIDEKARYIYNKVSKLPNEEGNRILKSLYESGDMSKSVSKRIMQIHNNR